MEFDTLWLHFAGISFTPREVGDYLVNVFRHNQHIPNSPFKIYVGETEIGNAGRVKVYGKGLSHGMANELNEFFVNTKDAGKDSDAACFIHGVQQKCGRCCNFCQ